MIHKNFLQIVGLTMRSTTWKRCFIQTPHLGEDQLDEYILYSIV